MNHRHTVREYFRRTARNDIGESGNIVGWIPVQADVVGIEAGQGLLQNGGLRIVGRAACGSQNRMIRDSPGKAVQWSLEKTSKSFQEYSQNC